MSNRILKVDLTLVAPGKREIISERIAAIRMRSEMKS